MKCKDGKCYIDGGKAGDKCPTDSWCESNICNQNVCIEGASVDNGKACTRDLECKSGWCERNKCRRMSREGEWCHQTKHCDAGLECSGVQPNRRCYRTSNAPAGSKCYHDHWCAGHTDGAWCEGTSLQHAGECKAATGHADGSVCRKDGNCTSGWCEGWRCRKTSGLNNGEKCRTWSMKSTECTSGWCHLGKCKAKAGENEWCGGDDSCGKIRNNDGNMQQMKCDGIGYHLDTKCMLDSNAPVDATCRHHRHCAAQNGKSICWNNKCKYVTQCRDRYDCRGTKITIHVQKRNVDQREKKGERTWVWALEVSI